MENASAALLEAVRRSMRPVRAALGSTVIDSALLTHAERLQHEGYLRREEAYGIIRALAQAGTPIKEIVRRTGRSRKLVREIVRGGGGDIFRCRSNSLEPHLAWLDAEWADGCRNGAELWRRLQASGFRGSLRVVAECATRRRRADNVGSERLRKPPSARVLSRLLLSERDRLTKDEAITLARIERGVPALVAARDLVDRFHRMVRDRDPAVLPALIGDLLASILASFGKGIAADRAAVTAALVEPWSNGPNRRPDHQAEARQTADVPTRQTGLAPRSPPRSGLGQLHRNRARAPFGCRSGVPIARRLTGLTIEWADLLRDLDRLQEATIEKDGKRITTRTAVTGQVGRVFQAAGVGLPPNLHERTA